MNIGLPALVFFVMAAGNAQAAAITNDLAAIAAYKEIASSCYETTPLEQPQQLILQVIGFVDMWPDYNYRASEAEGGGPTLFQCLAKAIASLEGSKQPEAERRIESWLDALLARSSFSDTTRYAVFETAFLCAAAVESAKPVPNAGRVRAKLDAYIDMLHGLSGSTSSQAARAQERYSEILAQSDSAAAVEYLRSLTKDQDRIVAERARGLLNRHELRTTPMSLSFTAFDGRSVDLAKLRGKVVLINFTGVTWCGGCRLQEPFLKAAYQKYHALGFEIISITYENVRGEDTIAARSDLVRKLLRERGIGWPHYFDGKGGDNPYVQKYAINGVPTHFLLDKSGLLVSTKLMNGKLEEEVRRLLGLENPPAQAAALEGIPIPH